MLNSYPSVTLTSTNNLYKYVTNISKSRYTDSVKNIQQDFLNIEAGMY